MKLTLRDSMTFFSRVKGRNGVVRELGSILDFNSEYCMILSRDALALGYNEAGIRSKQWQKVHPDMARYVLDFRGIERGVLLTLNEVSLGTMVAKDVETVLVDLDLPRAAPFDLVLGRSFLKHFRFEFDIKKGTLTVDQPRA